VPAMVVLGEDEAHHYEPKLLVLLHRAWVVTTTPRGKSVQGGGGFLTHRHFHLALGRLWSSRVAGMWETTLSDRVTAASHATRRRLHSASPSI
jgi:hypothetical protein